MASYQYKGYFEIPDNLTEILKIKELLKKRNETNNRLTDKLIKAFAAQVPITCSVADPESYPKLGCIRNPDP